MIAATRVHTHRERCPRAFASSASIISIDFFFGGTGGGFFGAPPIGLCPNVSRIADVLLLPG